MLTDKDLEQIENQELTISDLENQLARLEKGFSGLKLISAASINNGIETISEEDAFRYSIIYENFLLSGFKSQKFVPASGAATRMFKELFSFLLKEKNQNSNNECIVDQNYISYFFNNIEKFAFYDNLKKEVINHDSQIEWIEKLLLEPGFNYSNKPKGQITFHRYKEGNRTAFEEHVIEAIAYCTCVDGSSRVHFTISPEHKEGFDKLLASVRPNYQKRFGVHLDVTFSYQHNSTNSFAVDQNNSPIRDSFGNLLFSPGGHGSLIQNLEELDSDLIFIKTIDNVVPDRLKSETKLYKKALAGYLVTIRNKIFDFCEKLDHPLAFNNLQLLEKIEVFVKKELKLNTRNSFSSQDEKLTYYKTILSRPIRVCGMVKNTGEPGGGPFWASSSDGSISLQIVEKSQIDSSDESQVQILNSSTHFNPVDIICCIKNYKGEKYKLVDYIDPEMGFIVEKTKDGNKYRALERPGLWNGAMSNWTTLFVEVPESTFAPVKTINDLLRPEHL